MKKNAVLSSSPDISEAESKSNSILPAPKAEYYDLSDAQKRIWIIDNRMGGSKAYNMTSAFILHGNFEPEKFKTIFYALADKYEILRTTFRIVNGEPKQFISEKHNIKIEIKKVADKLQALVEYNNQANKIFNLGTGPLVDAVILEQFKDLFYLIINIHHIVCDGWSTPILTDEISRMYNELTDTGKFGINKISVNYKDFSFWKNNLLKNGGLDEAKNYWLEKLSGFSQKPALPYDFERKSNNIDSGKRIHLVFNNRISEFITKLAADCGATEFIVLSALLYLLIYRYSSNGDIIIGTASAGRNRPELEDQVGYFLSTLPLRVKVETAITFKELIEKVKITFADAYNYEDYPFDRIIEELGLYSDDSGNPLFDILILFQNTKEPAFNLNGIKTVPLTEESITSKFDLMFEFFKNKTIELLLEYNSGLFSENTIKIILEDFKNIIETLIINPSALLGEVLSGTNNRNLIKENSVISEDF